MSDQKELKHTRMINFIWIGVIFSGLYWILESIRDMLVFENGSIFKWIFMPSSMSLWMRVLVICIIMLFSAYTQSVRQKAESKKKSFDLFTKINIIWAGLGFGFLYWILEAFRDVVVFHKGNFLKQVFFPDPMGFWMRFLAVCMLILFSLYIKTLVNERKEAEIKLQQLREQLLKESDSQIVEMGKSREALQKQVGSFESEEKELRELLRQRDITLRSVHQVTKSNLQRLNSLFDMYIMDTDQKGQIELYTEIRTLIYTLTMIHSQLYSTDNPNQINLSGFLNDLKDYLLHLYRGGKINIYSEDEHLIIPTQQAVPCALAISELIFLATKNLDKNNTNGAFQIYLKRSEDTTLSVKIRYGNSKVLKGLEDKKPSAANYKWLQDLVKDQLCGDFWVVRNPQGIEINYNFETKV